MQKRKSIVTYILLIIGVIILVNLLADRFFVRLDFTADKRYTLSEPTKEILKSLKEPITITAYFSEELPSDFLQLRRDFKEELIEYANRSKGRVIFDFINPNKDEATEQKAQQEGINPVLINVREKDQVKQQKAYLGAVMHCGDKKEVIPVIQPGAAMEYSLSTNIKKLVVSNKPKIGFLEGHGEASLNSMIQLMQSLSVLYDVEPIKPGDTSRLDRFKTIVIIDPKDTIPPWHLQKLDEFLASGKNIYVAINRVNGNLQNLTGSEVNTGLEKWLEQKGLRVNPSFIIDENCGSVMVNQQQGMMTFQSSLRFPYLPMITKFEDTPATKGLSSVVLQFASPIDYFSMNKEVTYTPLAFTSDHTGTESRPLILT